MVRSDTSRRLRARIGWSPSRPLIRHRPRRPDESAALSSQELRACEPFSCRWAGQGGCGVVCGSREIRHLARTRRISRYAKPSSEASEVSCVHHRCDLAPLELSGVYRLLPYALSSPHPAALPSTLTSTSFFAEHVASSNSTPIISSETKDRCRACRGSVRSRSISHLLALHPLR